MTSFIKDSFTHDHHRCDRLLAAAESSLSKRDWTEIGSAVHALIDAMEQHFRAEEERLFPQLAAVFQPATSPIEVMTAEHAQMRALFEDLAGSLDARDETGCAGVLETLHFIVQQHNYKEENVLYPMADGALREQGEDIAASLPAA